MAQALVADAPAGVRPAPATSKVSMLQLVNSYRLGQLLSVAARLRVADVLRDGPRPVIAIAEATGTVAPLLHRVLRALAGFGVFEEKVPGTFALTPLGSTLRSDAPFSLRGAAAMIGEDWHWRPWSQLGHSVRTGEPAFDAVFGIPFYDAYEARAGLREGFDAATEDLERLAVMSIRAAYSFKEARRIVDVECAGGFGGLLFALLEDVPEAQGVLCDRQSIVERAGEVAKARGLDDRCELAPWEGEGPLPPGGDVYILRNVLRDCDDAAAIATLLACRHAMAERARILIIEMVVAPGNELSLGKLIDLDALLFTRNGRERSEEAYRGLARAAGLEVVRVVPTPGPLSIFECRPAQGGTR